MRHKIPVPRGWNRRAKSAILHILALSHYSFTMLLARAALSKNRPVRLRAQIDRRDREIALLHEELRFEDARMVRGCDALKALICWRPQGSLTPVAIDTS